MGPFGRRLVEASCIEVVRYIRSNRQLGLFGKRITVGEEHTHRYVTAIIAVSAVHLTVVTLDGKIVHQGNFNLCHILR